MRRKGIKPLLPPRPISALRRQLGLFVYRRAGRQLVLKALPGVIVSPVNNGKTLPPQQRLQLLTGKSVLIKNLVRLGRGAEAAKPGLKVPQGV